MITETTMDQLQGFSTMGEKHKPVGEEDVRALLDRDYGIRDASISMIPTERDDTFSVSMKGEGTPRFILKVEHPAESYDAVLLRARSLRCLEDSDSSIPATRLLPTRGGGLVSRLDSMEGVRWATLTTFLRGRLLARIPRPWPDSLSDGIGEHLARIERALAGLRDDADDVPGRVLWDVRLLPRLSSAILPIIGQSAHTRAERNRIDSVRSAVEVAVSHYGEVQNSIESLPVQLCHGDFHPGNLMVEGVPPRLCGILDFGDLHAMPPICDLGTCLLYLVDDDDDSDPFSACRDALRGFLRIVPETGESQLAVLPQIMEARAALTLLLPAFARLSAGVESGHYLSGDEERLERLRLLQGFGADAIRRGLGLGSTHIDGGNAKGDVRK